MSGDTFAVEEDDFEVVINWDDPLPQVGDPGPISVIQTGIDQTEKRGGGGSAGGRRKRKSDGASRELSKEVSDKPSLQAFKMIEGDTRGHEATTPRKLKRRPSSMPRAEREQPFDFQSDFEGVEDIFHW